ncbi:MAG: hypothetical protein HUJ98_04080 [Bacteroidaceae bacterium]|nr:hypothetical protein [Bacteroidaceae bacterium]
MKKYSKTEVKKARNIIEQGADVTPLKDLGDAQSTTRCFNGDGSVIKAGWRYHIDDTIYIAMVDMWDTEQYYPKDDIIGALWLEVEYHNGIRIIPDSINTTLQWSKDELGWRNDTLYKSLMDNNVWTPELYPSGWEVVQEAD